MSLDEDKLRKAFADLQRRVDYLERAMGLFADDEEMQGPRGDPKVKFAPQRWRGAAYVGKHFSECEPDFLDALAEALAWAADHPKKGYEKFAAYNRVDARRARRWARRMRTEGWTSPLATERQAGRPAGGPPTGGRPSGQRPGRPRVPAQSPNQVPPEEEPRLTSPQDVGFSRAVGNAEENIPEGQGLGDLDPDDDLDFMQDEAP